MQVRVKNANVRHNGTSYQPGDVLLIDEKHMNESIFELVEGGADDGEGQTKQGNEQGHAPEGEQKDEGAGEEKVADEETPTA